MMFEVSSHPLGAAFSKSAEQYENDAHLQRHVAAKLMRRLPADLQPRRLLELGCGTGFLTRELSARFPKTRIDALDVAPGMVTVAQKSVGANSSTKFLIADARHYVSQYRYDAIVSSSSLQWMRPLAPVFSNCRALMHSRSVLAAAVMTSDTLWELRRARDEFFPSKSLPRFLPTIEELKNDLEESRLLLRRCDVETFRLEYESAHELFLSLNELGLNAIPNRTLLSRRELLELEAAYARKYRIPSGGVGATFSVAYIEASLT